MFELILEKNISHIKKSAEETILVSLFFGNS